MASPGSSEEDNLGIAVCESCGSVCMTPAEIPAGAEGAAACCGPLFGAALSPGEAEATASLFKALAHPTRVRIVNLLANSTEPVCVCYMNEDFELSQPTMSHHLKKLVTAGVLKREQRGTWAYFSINEDARRRLAGVLNQGGTR